MKILEDFEGREKKLEFIPTTLDCILNKFAYNNKESQDNIHMAFSNEYDGALELQTLSSDH
jgi:hypothetical protein